MVRKLWMQLKEALPERSFGELVSRFPSIETFDLAKLSPAEASMGIELAGMLYTERSFRNGKSLSIAMSLLERAEVHFPEGEQWGWIQHHRGEILWYQAFMNPEKTADILEEALKCYQQALTVFTQDSHPEQWALTMSAQALVTVDRVVGDRTENLMNALQWLTETLSVNTFESKPEVWADTMINLGSVYGQLSINDAAENMEKSIKCISEALRVYTREYSPERWAILQVNLGTAHQHRVCGKTAENIELTISLYENSMTVFTRETNPERWAMINSNLGNAFSRRIYGDPNENASRAIAHYEAGLSIKNSRLSPFHQAMLRLNLSRILIKRGQTAKSTADIQRALDLCQEGLQICANNYPLESALLHCATAEALRSLPEVDNHCRKDYLSRARDHYTTALTIQTMHAMPVQNLEQNLSLAEVNLELDQWTEASEVLKEAMESCNIIYQQSFTEFGQNKVTEQVAPVYFLAALCAVKMGNPELAFRQLEKGKARILSGRLALDRMAFLSRDSDYKASLERELKIVNELEYRLQTPGVSPAEFVEVSESLKNHRKQIDKTLKQLRSAIGDEAGYIWDDSQVFQRILEPNTALVEPCITRFGTVIIVVSKSGNTDAPVCFQSISIDTFNTDDLLVIQNRWISDSQTLKSSGLSIKDIAEWENQAMSVLETLYRKLFKPVDELLNSLGIQKVIMVPHRFLHVLPLHLLPVDNDDKSMYLMDKYEVSYAPSAATLSHIRTPVSQPDSIERFVAISNPTGDLRFADFETQYIADCFPDNKVLSGSDATFQRVKEIVEHARYLHFACHGTFDLNSPAETGLLLAKDLHETSTTQICDESSLDQVKQRAIFFSPEASNKQSIAGKLMSVVDICHNLDLRNTELVVLSACESGLAMTTGSADEVIGLPTGFLQAGADAVVSSLWLVDDARGSKLITQFYHLYRNEGLPCRSSLRNAQLLMKSTGYGFYYWGGFIMTGSTD